MLELIIFIVVCYGFSNMVVYSNGPFHFFEWWRRVTNKISPKLGELFSCMMCFPSWVGLLLSCINVFLLPTIPFTPGGMLFLPYIVNFTGFYNVLITVLIIVIDTTFASGATWLLHNIEEWFEK